MRRSASSDGLPRLSAAPAGAAATHPLVSAAAGARGPARQRRLALHFRGYRLGLQVPSEMWGATALALRLAQPPGGVLSGGLPPQLQRSASMLAQAFGTAAAAPPPSGPISADHPKSLAEALDWRPQLSSTEEWACLLAPAAACAGVYAVTAPASVQPVYGAVMALLYLLLVAFTRMWLLERQYRAVQRTERELAAADSRFFALDGIQLHYKRCTPAAPRVPPGSGDKGSDDKGNGGGGGGVASPGVQSSPPAAVVHCLHGFGASLYSWSFVQQELANALRAVVTAHDMPGFGLTQRPRGRQYYTLHFSGDAARAIMDAEVAGTLGRRQQLQQQLRQEEGDQGGLGLKSYPLPTPAASRSSSWGDLAAAEEGTQQAQQQAEAQQAQQEEAQQAQQAQGKQAQQAQQQHPLEDSALEDSGEEAAAPAEPKRILIGHSMGGAAVAEGVISNPQGVAAIVLVAPAVVALWMGPPEEAAGDPVATGLAVVEELVAAGDLPGEVPRQPSSPQFMSRSDSGASSDSSSGSGTGTPRSTRAPEAATTAGNSSPGARAARAGRSLAAVAKAVLLLLVRLVLAAAGPLLVVVLRRLVRARRFWERGLASAWHDGSLVTREYVDAYRSGQLVVGWEGGILRFLSARFGEKHGFLGSVREAFRGEGHLSQAERLARVVRRHGIRVLIVHGSSDALVPAANSRRLAALLPNAELLVFEGCGHMPHEECPDRFVETVQRFVASLD